MHATPPLELTTWGVEKPTGKVLEATLREHDGGDSSGQALGRTNSLKTPFDQPSCMTVHSFEDKMALSQSKSSWESNFVVKKIIPLNRHRDGSNCRIFVKKYLSQALSP